MKYGLQSIEYRLIFFYYLPFLSSLTTTHLLNMSVVMEELQALQRKLQENIQNRTRLETQYQENKIVKEEFETLKEDANVYKLVGPVLLKQEKYEAEENVNKRIEFITIEIEKVEKIIKSIQTEMQGKRQSLT